MPYSKSTRHSTSWAAAILVVAAAACATPAAAQDAGDVARAKADLQAHGVSVAGACGAAKLTNLVVWRLRPAYGLLFKQGGNRAVLRADGSCLSGDESSEGGYATDYVIQRSTGGGFDLLGDGGGANNPQWAGPENDPATIARNFQNFREPIDPRGYYAEFTPTPAPTPAPLPPAPLPTLDLSAVYAQFAILNAKLDELARAGGDAHAAIEANVTAAREENRTFFEAVKTQWKAFVGKAAVYAGPIIAALFAGRATK